jgi:F5/8 type C domain
MNESDNLDNRFARRRVIVVRHRGNIANKLLQYMGALTLACRIQQCSIVNVSIPEFGIDIRDDTDGQRFFDNVDLWTWDPFRPHIEELSELANKSPSIRIMMADHLQRMEFLKSPEFYKPFFPSIEVSTELTDQDLLINIRTAEILHGVAHYPILPIAFYEDIVARTKLRPVFVGQLAESEYVRQLKIKFPNARFISSGGARADFDLIRSAKNIVVAVSTFSWLAAWLSQANMIILPLSGFFNPAHHREVDLLPTEDIRYRFVLFPLNFGLPEAESLQHHERMRGFWKEVSRNQVALLRTAAPFLRPPRENYDSGLPVRSARGSAVTIDSIWYAHQYVEAAMEISEGWFEDPLHHYLEVGRLRGYLPTAPLQGDVVVDVSLANIALNKPATQSSLSQWSKGTTPEEDAANAVNGNPSKDYGFHTEADSEPWWLVDLERVAEIHYLRIFNRDFVPEDLQRRTSPLRVEISNDRSNWSELFITRTGQVFGGYSTGRPLLWTAKDPVKARFVRLSIPRRGYFHLSEVEIYGR